MVMAWKDGLWHWVCHVSVNTLLYILHQHMQDQVSGYSKMLDDLLQAVTGSFGPATGCISN